MKKLPSVKLLLNEAWEMLTPSLLPLFKLSAISLLMVVLLGGLFAGLALGGSMAGGLDHMNVPLIVFSSVAGGLSLFVISVAINIALVETIEKKGSIAPLVALKSAFPRVLPLFITGLLTTFLIMGSAVLFLMPGILVLLLLSFANLEVILNKQSPLQAIKRSAQIVQENFGQLFVKWGAYFLIYIGIAVIIPNILQNMAPRLTGLIELIKFFVSFILGWFTIAYSIVIYKKLNKTPRTKSVWWMWLMAAIGWVIFFLLIGSIMQFISSSPAFINAFTKGVQNKNMMQNEQMMEKYQRQYKQEYKQQMEQYESSQDSDTYTQ